MKKSPILTALLAGCATYRKQAEAPQPGQIEESRGIAKTLATQLGGKLKDEPARNGP